MSLKNFEFKAVIAVLAVFGVLFAIGAEPPEQPKYQKYFDNFKQNNKIDELVLNVLKSRDIPPSETCPDDVFLRRACLDLTGTIPLPRRQETFWATRTLKNEPNLLTGFFLKMNLRFTGP